MFDDQPTRVQSDEALPSTPAQSAAPERSSFIRWCLAQYKEFVAALGFLSTLPTPGSAQLFRTDATESGLIIGSAYFPLVGLLIGFIACLLLFAFGVYLPAQVLAALLVVVLVWLTGGLHLDGLMDTCDGIFGASKRERKLEIMRDSRVGSFGVLGGGCILLLKFALFASLSTHVLLLAVLFVLPAARWAMVLAIYLFPSARPGGLGMAVRQTVSLRRLLVAGMIVLAIALLVGHLAGLAAWLLASLLAVAIGAWITRQLGGLTGDIYGAIAEITEVACFLIVLLLRNLL